MNVLIISHIFWPESADFRNLALATELIANGHDVTVLTAFPNYPLGRIYDGYKLAWRQWEIVNGARVLRVPIYPDHSSSGFKRIINYVSFTLSASTIGLLLVRNIDVIFVYSPPMTLGFTAALFKFFHHAPILLDVVDLWPDAIFGSGMVSSALIVNLSGWVARSSYRLADKITVLTKGFASRLELAGVAKEKISVIPPWADIDCTEPCKEFGDKYDLHGKFCIIHTGNIGPFQDIENILLAADQLRDISSLRFIFVGSGRDIGEMKRLKELHKLDNVIFTGMYPAESMAGILAWGNALLVSLRSDPYLAINLPGKVPTYLASGRPLIACAEGESSQLVTINHCGINCPPGNPALLAETIRHFVSLSEKERAEMGYNSRQVFEKHYNKKILINKYITMLESMVQNG